MIVYSIAILTADDELITFEDAYLYHHNDQDIQSWEVEVIGTNEDTLIHKLMDKQNHIKLKMGIVDGSSFIGMTLITKYQQGPLGSKVLFAGSGELKQVESRS